MASIFRLPLNRFQGQVNGNLGNRNHPTSVAQEPLHASNSSGSSSHIGPDKNEAQIPSELITTCVATLLMIQVTSDFILTYVHLRNTPPSGFTYIIMNMDSYFACN